MKKTVFEGTINGEQFDNVVDYNKRMQELLGQGVQVNASSNTRTIDEPTEIPAPAKDILNSGRMYPGFETMTLGTDFIEKALEHHNEDVADSFKRYVQENVIPELNKMNREDLGIYLGNLDKILAHLGTIERKNEDAIDGIDRELQELQKKLDECSSRLSDHQAIGGVLEMFTHNYSELKDRAIEIASRQIQGCQCNGCSCGHPDPVGERGESGTPTGQDSVAGILKLVREIFKD